MNEKQIKVHAHLVLAGNYNAYLRYLREHPKLKGLARFVRLKEDLFRFPSREVALHRAGEWWKNPMAYHEQLEVIQRRMKGPHHHARERRAEIRSLQ